MKATFECHRCGEEKESEKAQDFSAFWMSVPFPRKWAVVTVRAGADVRDELFCDRCAKSVFEKLPRAAKEIG